MITSKPFHFDDVDPPSKELAERHRPKLSSPSDAVSTSVLSSQNNRHHRGTWDLAVHT
jgi:hypothetical protein